MNTMTGVIFLFYTMSVLRSQTFVMCCCIVSLRAPYIPKKLLKCVDVSNLLHSVTYQKTRIFK